MSLREVTEAADLIHDAADDNMNLIFGAGINDSLGDSIRVTIIATGFRQRSSAQRPDPLSEELPPQAHIEPQTKGPVAPVKPGTRPLPSILNTDNDDLFVPPWLSKNR